MDTKKCICCERELPVSEFLPTRIGSRSNTCHECRRAKRRETLAAKRPHPSGAVSDPDFDGKDPVEVIQMMSRAKRWLESRGYSIQLSGEYNVKKRIKF